MGLIKVHRAIRFKSSIYVASYILNNTAKRQQFKHYNVKKSFYKLRNNAPYKKTIEDVARRTDVCFPNEIKKARKLAVKPHCVYSAFSMARWPRQRSKYRPRLQKSSNIRRR